ncbi:hypothetical protein IEO21_06904 [Rhodonia placenta]|uniref:Uncharacterized protein n=1 Tax=Rhodonia placenta TaxID=104341 RepID=A0A8H7NZJ8_9APHY|nr:hypothetical protein IEO21_06904 [Postia placenta]
MSHTMASTVPILFVLNILLMMRSRDFNTVQSSLSPRPIYCMPNFITTTLLLAGNTFHWIVAVFRVYQAFILFHNGSEPLLFYSDLSQTSELILTGALVFCVVVGDVMISVASATFINSRYQTIMESLAINGSPRIVFLPCGMIAWKIWSIRRGIGCCGGSNIMRMLVFVVESAALYSMTRTSRKGLLIQIHLAQIYVTKII